MPDRKLESFHSDGTASSSHCKECSRGDRIHSLQAQLQKARVVESLLHFQQLTHTPISPQESSVQI